MIFSFLLPFVKRKLEGRCLKVHGNSCSLLFCPSSSSSQASGNLLPFQRPSLSFLMSGRNLLLSKVEPKAQGFRGLCRWQRGTFFPAPVKQGIVPSLSNGYYDNFLITDEAVMARVLFPPSPPTDLPLIFMLVSR